MSLPPGTRGSIRDNIAGSAKRSGSRLLVRLGRTRLHHREGQGYKAITQRTARLEQHRGQASRS